MEFIVKSPVFSPTQALVKSKFVYVLTPQPTAPPTQIDPNDPGEGTNQEESQGPAVTSLFYNDVELVYNGENIIFN